MEEFFARGYWLVENNPYVSEPYIVFHESLAKLLAAELLPLGGAVTQLIRGEQLNGK